MERKKKKKTWRYRRAAWQQHRATQLAEGVLVFPSKEVNMVVLQFDIVLRCSNRQEWSGIQNWPCSPLRPVTSVVFLVFINTSVVLTCFVFFYPLPYITSNRVYI